MGRWKKKRCLNHVFYFHVCKGCETMPYLWKWWVIRSLVVGPLCWKGQMDNAFLDPPMDNPSMDNDPWPFLWTIASPWTTVPLAPKDYYSHGHFPLAFAPLHMDERFWPPETLLPNPRLIWTLEESVRDLSRCSGRITLTCTGRE